jgi:hypothetical protein
MCVRKTPLTEVFYFLPGNGARKELDCWLMLPEKSWCLVELPAHWEPQEEGVMNIAARFSLS